MASTDQDRPAAGTDAAGSGPERVVIVGAGFTGFFAARKLRRLLPADRATISVVTDSDGLLYQPLLPEVAVGILDPRTVSVPLTTTLPGVQLVRGRATAVDFDARELTVAGLDDTELTVGYDRLLIVPGSVSRVLDIPGLAEHGVGFKTTGQALYLRDLVLRRMERAGDESDPAVRRRLLSFIVVGAGYAGTELVAQMALMTEGLRPRFTRIGKDDLTWMLLDTASAVMPELGSDLGERAVKVLRARGVDVRLQTSVDEITADHAHLTDGTTVPGATVVWCAGVTANPFVAATGLSTVKGRLTVNADLTVPHHPGVYAAGDAAAVPDITRPRGKDGRHPVCPPTAQHAMRQGTAAAKVIAADVLGQERKAYRHRDLGLVVELGGSQAVARPVGIALHGRVAKLVTRGYHVFALPTMRRRLRVLADWALAGRQSDDVSLGLPPETAVLASTEHTDRAAGH